MKTLYVSDLDGTLFNTQKRVTLYTAQVVNHAVAAGCGFAVATARMPYGCDYRLADLHMNTPGITTNGVFLYDFAAQKYCAVETIPRESALRALEAFAACEMPCFLYTFAEDAIRIGYNSPALTEQTQYYSDRALAVCRSVEYVPQLAGMLEQDDACYFAVTGTEEALRPVCRKLDDVDGIAYSFYLNIYNGLYCLEAFSAAASKRRALEKLRALTGCEELVVFGDNLNDLSMIEIADRSYAPQNALEVVKQRVTAVIGSCDEDGVAHFIEQDMASGTEE